MDKEQRNVIEKTESNPLFLKFLLNKILLHKHAGRSNETKFLASLGRSQTTNFEISYSQGIMSITSLYIEIII